MLLPARNDNPIPTLFHTLMKIAFAKPESNRVQMSIFLISMIMFATTFAVLALVNPLLVGTASAKHNGPLMMIIALMIGMSTIGSLARQIEEKTLLRLSLDAFVRS